MCFIHVSKSDVKLLFVTRGTSSHPFGNHVPLLRFFGAHCPLKPSPRVQLPTAGFGTQVLVWGAVGTRTLTACWDSRLRRTQGPGVHTGRTTLTHFSIENVSSHPNTMLPSVLQLALPAASLPGAGRHATQPCLDSPQLCSTASRMPCRRSVRDTLRSSADTRSPPAPPPTLPPSGL